MNPWVRILGTTGLLTLLLGFQNCSNVDFGTAAQDVAGKTNTNLDSDDRTPQNEEIPDLSEETKDPVEEPNTPEVSEDPGEQPPTGDEVLDEVIAKNPACDPLFEALPAMELNGEDFIFAGIQGQLSLKNGGELKIKGITQSISVNGSDSVEVNGVHNLVCAKSKEFKMAGVFGYAHAPTVLIGEGNAAKISHLSGVRPSDLVLINIQSIGHLNGVSGDIYIHSGQVDTIVGVGKDLHLMGGTHVRHIKGLFRRIYLYDNASIGNLHGIFKIVQRP